MSWSLRLRDAPSPRTNSSAKLRLIVTALAAYGVARCPRLRQPRALFWSKRRAGRSFKLLAAKDGAQGYGSRAVFNKARHTEDSFSAPARPLALSLGVLLEPPPAQRPPPRPNGRRHCARNYPHGRQRARAGARRRAWLWPVGRGTVGAGLGCLRLSRSPWRPARRRRRRPDDRRRHRAGRTTAC